MLVGSIASLGSQYVITLDAVNATTGDSLAKASAGREKGIGADGAHRCGGNRSAQKLGESLASIQKFDKPLAEATTSSLEALKAFSLGDMPRQKIDSDRDSVLPACDRTRSQFRHGLRSPGNEYSNLGQRAFGAYRQKAFDLRDRASERERLYITSHYYAIPVSSTRALPPLTLQADLSAGLVPTTIWPSPSSIWGGSTTRWRTRARRTTRS